MSLRHQVNRSRLGVLRGENSKFNTRRLFNQQGVLVRACSCPKISQDEGPRIVMCEESESCLMTGECLLLGKKSCPESVAITRSKRRKAAAKAAISAETNLFSSCWCRWYEITFVCCGFVLLSWWFSMSH